MNEVYNILAKTAGSAIVRTVRREQKGTIIKATSFEGCVRDLIPHIQMMGRTKIVHIGIEKNEVKQPVMVILWEEGETEK